MYGTPIILASSVVSTLSRCRILISELRNITFTDTVELKCWPVMEPDG